MPNIPEWARPYLGNEVFHSNDYLLHPIDATGRAVTVVGGGQSSAEVPVWVATVIGAAVALRLALAFLPYQWRAWTRVAVALPMRARAGSGAGPHP